MSYTIAQQLERVAGLNWVQQHLYSPVVFRAEASVLAPVEMILRLDVSEPLLSLRQLSLQIRLRFLQILKFLFCLLKGQDEVGVMFL